MTIQRNGIYYPDVNLGMPTIKRAVTETLYVSPNGNNIDGSNWVNVYTTIQGALGAASTDANECTLILIAINTGANNYDIDTTGDPTYSGNYILKGTHRTWAKIKNTHASATSILKFTGYVSLEDLNFNLGSGSGNGVIITKSAFRVRKCQFVGEDLTGAATALHIDGATVLKHGIIEDCHFRGHVTHMTGILLDKAGSNLLNGLYIHDCLKGVQVVDSDSDHNLLYSADIGDCAIGVDIDAGNVQVLTDVIFHGNTLNIDDEVGDHIYTNVDGSFVVSTEPDDFTGVNVPTGDGADLWGADTEVRAAASSTVPFRIISFGHEADASEKFRVRMSADGGSTYFTDFQFEGVAAGINTSSASLPSGTEYIFNKGTQILAAAKSESAGIDNVAVWLEIQEI